MMFLGKPSESGSARLGHIPMQFHLLRKRGLLAHTSAAFLKKLLHRKTFWLPAARFLQRLLKYFL